MSAISPEEQTGLEQFLYHEARLLEENRFTEWLALFAPEARYRLPVRHAVQPGKAPALSQSPFFLFDDDRPSLEMRVLRLESGTTHSEGPFSITLRMITNVVARPSPEPSVFDVTSRFHVHQERLGRHTTTFIGKRLDRIARTNGDYLILQRDIELAQTVLPATISIFL